MQSRFFKVSKKPLNLSIKLTFLALIQAKRVLFKQQKYQLNSRLLKNHY